MKFFNIDLHVSVIEDIKTIFKDLGHEVDSKNISSHNWVFNRQADKVDIIGQHNWTSISPKICNDFYERYKDELSDYDGFIVTYPPSFSLLFEKFNKPIIVVAATRYEAPFTNNITKWDKFNDYLRNKIDERMIIPLANNLYDKAYCDGFTDREWTHIPSLCEYTNLKYTGQKKEFVLCTKSENIDHPQIIKKQSLKDRSWEHLYSHKGIIHVPYNISTMSIFEQKTAGIPLMFPSLKYLQQMKGSLSELWFGGAPRRSIGMGYLRDEKSLGLADFYQWKEVLLFDNNEELFRLMKIIDFESFSKLSLEENKKTKEETYRKWKEVLCKIDTVPKVPKINESKIKTKGSNITFGVLASEQDFGKGRGSAGILNTWGGPLKNILFATDGDNADKRFIKLTNHKDLASNCEKQLKILIYLADKCRKTEWYALVDDDTYIYVDNLVNFLKDKKTKSPICYGYMMSLWPGDKTLIHPSGGAGYILNNPAIKLLSNGLQNIKSLKTYTHWKSNNFNPIKLDKEVDRTSHPVNSGFGDVTIGLYMRELGVEVVHCDKFHSRQPWTISNQRSQGEQFVDEFKIKTSSFDKNITFHTITEKQMYNENWEKIQYLNTTKEYNNI